MEPNYSSTSEAVSCVSFDSLSCRLLLRNGDAHAAEKTIHKLNDDMGPHAYFLRSAPCSSECRHTDTLLMPIPLTISFWVFWPSIVLVDVDKNSEKTFFSSPVVKIERKNEFFFISIPVSPDNVQQSIHSA